MAHVRPHDTYGCKLAGMSRYDYGGSLAAMLGLVISMVASWMACQAMLFDWLVIVAKWLAFQTHLFEITENRKKEN